MHVSSNKIVALCLQYSACCAVIVSVLFVQCEIYNDSYLSGLMSRCCMAERSNKIMIAAVQEVMVDGHIADDFEGILASGLQKCSGSLRSLTLHELDLSAEMTQVGRFLRLGTYYPCIHKPSLLAPLVAGSRDTRPNPFNLFPGFLLL